MARVLGVNWERPASSCMWPEDIAGLVGACSNQNSVKKAVDGKAAANITARAENALSQVRLIGRTLLLASMYVRVWT